MKKLVFLFTLCFAVFGSGMVIAGELTNSNPVSIDIPFGFYVGNQHMPAGEYLVDLPTSPGSMTGSLLRVRSADGERCQYLNSMRIGHDTIDSDFRMLFNKYGKKYFLSRVHNSEIGLEVPESRSEKEAAEALIAAGSGAMTSVEIRVTLARVK